MKRIIMVMLPLSFNVLLANPHRAHVTHAVTHQAHGSHAHEGVGTFLNDVSQDVQKASDVVNQVQQDANRVQGALNTVNNAVDTVKNVADTTQTVVSDANAVATTWDNFTTWISDNKVPLLVAGVAVVVVGYLIYEHWKKKHEEEAAAAQAFAH